LITEFTKSVNNTFYFSALLFLFLAIFYGIYFMKKEKYHNS
ncbi:MFS transporter, partial [Enterobacter mori]